MIQTVKVGNLTCRCSAAVSSTKIVYILYPMDMLADWIEPAARKYGVTMAVLTGMDWQNVFSPWPAPGVPKGTADFKGESPEFLKILQHDVLPQVEQALGIDSSVERTLVGVSMSGLFALWQWMVCDTFRNIASLSGSFWYAGFVGWMKGLSIPPKQGKAFFLLGDQEAKSNVSEFATVGRATDEIVALLRDAGIDTEFVSVRGNHYSDPLPRLDRALSSLFG